MILQQADCQNILSGIRYKFAYDSMHALELIDKLLHLRKINLSLADPDTRKQLIGLIVDPLDLKPFSSYHNAPSQPGSERHEGRDRIPEFRKALLLTLNSPEDTSNQDILTVPGL